MLNRIAFAIAVVLLMTCPSRAQDVCQRQVETAGGFSICIPAGWRIQESEGQKFKVLFGTPGERFTPNINFKEGNSPVLIKDYVTASIDYILNHVKETGADSVKLMSQTPFTTASGAPGIKVAFRAEFQGRVIRSLQYFFNGTGDQKLIMTATSMEVDEATLDPIFDRTANSFRLEK